MDPFRLSEPSGSNNDKEKGLKSKIGIENNYHLAALFNVSRERKFTKG